MNNSPDQLMRQILSQARCIAVVGASNKPARASHGVMQFLQQKGFRCIPVNPRLAGTELLGETVHASLADIDTHIDLVDVFVNSSLAGAVVDQAIAVGADAVWLQLNVIDEVAAERARAAGLRVVMDRCPAQEWSRLGMP